MKNNHKKKNKGNKTTGIIEICLDDIKKLAKVVNDLPYEINLKNHRISSFSCPLCDGYSNNKDSIPHNDYCAKLIASNLLEQMEPYYLDVDLDES